MTALACLMGGGSVLSSPAGYAQAVNPDAPSPTRQEATPDIRVNVTGSNIKQVEGEGALPVTVITREQIDKSGATSAMELLQLVSSNNSLGAVNISNSVGATTLSAQTASLRGLGGGRTLVLINGHRIDSFAGEIQGVQGVNLAGIPFAAIARVEILKDGASAIYGSDAIGGVINFITRTDYTGAEVTGFYGKPTRGGGGQQWQGTVTAGWGDLAKDRWNFFLSGSYNEQKPLDQVDRSFSNSSYDPDIGLYGLSSNTFPGRITTGGIGVVSNGQVANSQQACASNTYFNDQYISGCYFDPARVHGVEMIPDQKTANFYSEGRLQISSDWQAYLTALYSHDQSHLIIQPGPVSNVFNYGPLNDIPSTITLQPSSPFYPHQAAANAGVDGQPLNIRYRTFDNGFRDTTDTNQNGEIVTGVKGTWRDWDIDASGFYSEGTTAERINGGFQDYRLLLPILNSGVVNFFGPNTPAVVALERTADITGDVFNGTTKNYGGQIKGSGAIYKLPAGPLSLALGVEARREEFDQIASDALAGGEITGYGGPIQSTLGKRRNAFAAFGELDIPIVKTLEGNVAVRYDHYSDFGGTTNPKVSLRWQPMRTLLFRGSYGTGFLAPSLYQLYTPQIGGVTQPGLSDPIRCPMTQDTGFDCSTQFAVLFGGNAALKPEQSEQATAGFVIEPIPHASFSVDYFKISLKNAISGISPGTILGDLGKYGSLVTRGPVDPAFPNLPGRITQINQLFINLGEIRMQGLDIEGHYRTPMQVWGRLSFNVAGTYYLHYDQQNPDGSFTGEVGTALDSLGTGVIPRWKHYASATWDQGPWSATLAQTFQGTYTDQETDFNTHTRTVGVLSLWDVNASYTGFKSLKLVLGVKNLFDRDPPKANQQSTFIAGFDPSFYDPRARFVYTTLAYTFK